MAGNDSKKQLFTLISDFATERSQGEHRVSNLKKQIDKLQFELDSANKEHEEAKRIKEATEQDLRGYEVELSVNDASLQSLESRIALTRNEVSAIGSEIETLKSEEGAKRDDFISKMVKLNAQIRKFQESDFNKESDDETTINTGMKDVEMEESENSIKDLENELSVIISQTNQLKQEYEFEQNALKQAQIELNGLEKKTSLVEAIMKESAELQELTKQNSELEESYSLLGEELQRRCVCPNCQKDNSDSLNDLLQARN